MAKRLSLYLRQEELDRLTYIEQTLKIKYKDFLKNKINEQYHELRKYDVGAWSLDRDKK